jgi:hypothetical protein
MDNGYKYIYECWHGGKLDIALTKELTLNEALTKSLMCYEVIRIYNPNDIEVRRIQGAYPNFVNNLVKE